MDRGPKFKVHECFRSDYRSHPEDLYDVHAIRHFESERAYFLLA